MPAIWSSSERPISVREVWVDGIRHAILSPDDPFHNAKNRQRPQTFPSKSKKYPVKYVSRDEPSHCPTENLDNCLIKFHVLTGRKNTASLAVTKITRRQSAPPISQPLDDSRDLLDLLPTTGLLKTPRNTYERIDGDRNQLICSQSHQEMPTFSREDTLEKCDVSERFRITNNIIKTVVQFSDQLNESYNEQESNHNPLSERVLYWMDMSGRVKNFQSKEESQRVPTSDRRSSVGKSRERSLLLRNSMIPFRDSETDHHYRFCPNSMKQEHSFYGIHQEGEGSGYMSEKLVPEVRQEDIPETEVILENNKFVWSPYGRPQLHIFMPDLNLSGHEDEPRHLHYSPSMEDTLE